MPMLRYVHSGGLHDQFNFSSAWLPRPGRWRLRIDVLINDFEKATLEDDILIRP